MLAVATPIETFSRRTDYSMSGLPIPQSLKTLFSSKVFSRRWRERASSRKARQRMLLLVENLERRELMASDLGYNPMHNALVPTDVNGDFAITPIDVLQVVNALNRSSNGSGEGSSSSTSSFSPMTDVNNDGITSPIDALMVINRLRTGEGVGELAELGFQVLDGNGAVLTPVDVGGLPEYTLGFDQSFTLRTRAKDTRATGRLGVAITYADIAYSTVEGSTPTDDIVKVQWGEFQTIRIGSSVVSGTFTLTYGSETTAPITYDEDNIVTRENIRNAVGALSFSGGVNNIRVEDVLFESPSTDKGYGIVFIGGKVRTDVPDATLGSNNLVGPGGAAVSFAVTSSSNPNNANVLGAAISSPANTGAGGSQFFYNSGKKQGRLVTNSSTSLTIDDAGNFLGSQPSLASSTAFFNIFDTAFKTSGSVPGAVNFTVGSANSSSLGIGLFGRDTVVPDNMITFPANPTFRIRVAGAVQIVGDTTSVNEDSGVNTISVLSNDIVSSGGALSISAVTQPASGGTVAIAAGNTAVTFTPAANFFGQTTFTYTAGNSAATGTATVTVNVNPVNDAPVNRTTVLPAVEGSSNNIYTPSDLFPSSGPGESGEIVTLSSVALVGGQTGGTVSINGSGNVVFNTTPGFNGNVLFVATGTDNGTPNASAIATFTISVTPVNDPPVAIQTAFDTNEDISLNITPVQMFSPGPADEASQTLTLKSVVPSGTQTGGTIASQGGNAVFTPTPNFFGSFVFVAVVTDNGVPPVDSQPSTITINVAPVNDAPTAVADTLNAFGGVSVELDVLVNDTSGPGENDNLVITAVGTNNGSATITADGKRIRYTAPVNLIGSSDAFSYTISDGSLTSTANVQVSIVSPTLPFAVVDSVTVAENGSKVAIRVLDNDLVNSGETKRLEASTIVLTPSALGTVERNENGTPSNLTDDFFEFTPAANANGTGFFTYVMNDTKVGSVASIGTVNITVTEVNTPPTAQNQTVAGTEDVSLPISLATLTTGATKGVNEDNQVLSVTSATMLDSTRGSVAIVGGNVVFTPARDVNGQVLITFVLTDNGTTNGVAAPLSSAPATVTVNLAAVNDPPTAVNDTFSVAEDGTLTRPLTDLSGNDSSGPSNESSQTRTVTGVAMVAGSTGTIVISGNNFVFTPVANFNGTVFATYVVRDSGSPAQEATGTITINVTEVNDAPVPVAATRQAFVGTTTTINLTSELAQASRGAANESGQTLRVNRVIPLTGANATQGNVVLNTDGTISYTPSANVAEETTDAFDYEIIDNGTTNGSADPKVGVGRITINVKPFQASTVKGRIWIDDNNSGTYDQPEVFIQGVLVTLSGRATGSTQNITPFSTRTDNDGNYSFSNVRPGDYTVSFANPAFTVDAPEAEQRSFNIAVPGNQTVEADFRVLAVSTVSNVLWDNLLSTYYRKNGQEWATRGFTALVGPNGTTQWNIHRGGFESYRRIDISMNAQGVLQIDAYSVDGQGVMQHSRASVPRNRFYSVPVDGGNTLIRIFAMPSDLSFTNVGATPAINAEGFGFESVDGIFANDEWR